MSLYLILNIATFCIPFLYSFEPRMHYIKRWKSVFSGIIITAFVFILWDIIFTKIGVWSFNPRYHSGVSFFELPLEEWLFFICIPYSSIFIHFVFIHFFPNISLSIKIIKIIYGLILLTIFPLLLLNTHKWYTLVNFSFLILILTISIWKFPNVLQTYFLTFLIILIPFTLVNGILTGSFIKEPVVIYNNLENLGIRMGTIPIEDIGYTFSMILMSLILINKFENENI